MKRILSIIVLMILCFSCSSDDDTDTSDPVFCTDELVPGLKIEVSGTTADFSVTGVTVRIVDGNYTEILENQSDTNTFFGAYERKGNYTITVTKEGFTTYQSQNPIAVEADLCHVITESVEVLLERQ